MEDDAVVGQLDHRSPGHSPQVPSAQYEEQADSGPADRACPVSKPNEVDDGRHDAGEPTGEADSAETLQEDSSASSCADPRRLIFAQLPL
jgi:hypothetical protein